MKNRIIALCLCLLIIMFSLSSCVTRSPSDSYVLSEIDSVSTISESSKPTSDSVVYNLSLSQVGSIDFYYEKSQDILLDEAAATRQKARAFLQDETLFFITSSVDGSESICAQDISSGSISEIFRTTEYVVSSFLCIDNDRMLIEAQYMSSTLPSEYPVPIHFLYLYTISTKEIISINELYELQDYYPDMSTYVQDELMHFDGPPEYFYAYSNGYIYMVIRQNNAEGNTFYMLRIHEDGSVLQLPFEIPDFGHKQAAAIDGSNAYVFDEATGNLYAFHEKSVEPMLVLKCNGQGFSIKYVIDGALYLQVYDAALANGTYYKIDLYTRSLLGEVKIEASEPDTLETYTRKSIIPLTGDVYWLVTYQFKRQGDGNSLCEYQQVSQYTWDGKLVHNFNPFEHAGHAFEYILHEDTLYYLDSYGGRIVLRTMNLN